ncbi:MAG: DUF6599 family protein [Deltaproteobacteria bacterium]
MRLFFQKNLFLFFLLCTAFTASAGEKALQTILPVPACSDGWLLDGKIRQYNKDNLFERINGESELYFPYGFEGLTSAIYVNRKNPQIAVEADVYQMGSLLDAFGMFANYSRRDDTEVVIGGDGTISDSQLFFYQDRYLIRLQTSGPSNPPPEVFLACARAIAKNLPANPGKPHELEAFGIPGVDNKSVRYIASSLLGYDFFRRGLMADASLNGQPVQLFLVTEDSETAAAKVFEQYRSYLNKESKEHNTAGTSSGSSIRAIDPLYSNVVVEKYGRFIIGAVRVKDLNAAVQAVEKVRQRVEGK